jgi:hypothetical protein
MKRFACLALLLALAGFPSGARAFDADHLKAYCQDGNHNYKITPGLQPNQRPAVKSVLDLKPGRYLLPDGSRLEVNDPVEVQVADSRSAKPVYLKQVNPTYTLWIKPKKNPLFGTHAADDIAGQEFGGCSLEQLSELLQKNRMPMTFAADNSKEDKR